MLRERVGLVLLAFAFVVSGCDGPDGPDGITIPETDDTAPTLGLLVDPEFGVNISVSSGGMNEATTIHRRTGKISFLVSAKDSESGIRRLEIWMTNTTTTCDSGGMCTKRGPGLAGQPRFDADFGEKNPGDQTSETALMTQELQVESEIGSGMPPPGGSRTVKLEFWGAARNHRTGEAKTAIAAVTLQEQG
jgi:hypothetical protein